MGVNIGAADCKGEAELAWTGYAIINVITRF